MFLSFSELTPVDPNAIAGEYLNMTCQLNLTHPKLFEKFSASDVYFQIHEHNLPTKYVHVVSNSRADLKHPHITIQSNERYIRCIVNTSTNPKHHLLVDSQWMLVGRKYDRCSRLGLGHGALCGLFYTSSLSISFFQWYLWFNLLKWGLFN